MKKIAAIAIGLGLILGSVSFAQDAPKKEETKKEKKGKKKADKKDDKKM